MNILVLNGSPRGANSITMQISNVFLSGYMNNKNDSLEVINIYEKKINNCIGCYHCWNTKEGKCIHKDDVDEIIEKFLNADTIVWSFPIYAHGMPSKIKAFMERLIPIDYPYIEKREDGGSKHVQKHSRAHHKYFLISSGGLYSQENNFEALLKQFDILYGDNYHAIICTESELFKIDLMKNKVERYLKTVNKAGEQYRIYGKLNDVTAKQLDNLLMNPNLYIETANESWYKD